MAGLGKWAQPWWVRYAGRLDWELEKLIALGLRFSIDDDARRGGILRITVDVPKAITGTDFVSLVVTFPSLYPQFRPRVTAPSLAPLPHHHDPFGDDLCLVARGSTNWSEQDSLAWLISEQLPRVLEAPEKADPGQAEPYSAYFTYAQNAVVLVESDRLPSREAEQGTLKLSMPPHGVGKSAPWMGALTEFGWADDNVEASKYLANVGDVVVGGAWIRLGSPPDTDDPESLWLSASALLADGLPAATRTAAGHYFQALVVLFPEEQSFDQKGDGVIVLLRDEDRRTRLERRQAKMSGAARKPSTLMIRTSRAGAADLSARDPSLFGLAAKRIVVVGCGAIGSVVVDTLARAGVGALDLIDGDVLEAGNLMRHAGAINSVGLGKAAAMAMHAMRVHPGIEANAYDVRVGRLGRPDDDAFAKAYPADILAKADIVVDATAEIAVHEILAEMSRDLGRAFITAEATHGAWGGMVGVFPPTASACWNCLELSLLDGSVSVPMANDAGHIQPPGCSEPTFPGSGFDLSEVALQAARTAVFETVTASDEVVFFSVNLRNDGGERVPPRWDTTTLGRHRSCEWSH